MITLLFSTDQHAEHAMRIFWQIAAIPQSMQHLRGSSHNHKTITHNGHIFGSFHTRLQPSLATSWARQEGNDNRQNEGFRGSNSRVESEI